MTQSTAIACVAAVVAVTGVALVLALPGETESPGQPIALVQYVDCSPSMVDVLPEMRPAMRRITNDAVRPGSLLLAGSFAGPPSQSAHPWAVESTPELDLDATGGNEGKALERMRIDAEDEVTQIVGMLECADGRRPGSPLLSALEAAATALGDAHVDRAAERRVVLYTDGAIVGDGLDVRTGVTRAQARAAVGEWAPRLRGLRNATVWIVGANSGSHIDQATMRSVRFIFDGAITRAGGRLASFGPSTASYPLGS